MGLISKSPSSPYWKCICMCVRVYGIRVSLFPYPNTRPQTLVHRFDGAVPACSRLSVSVDSASREVRLAEQIAINIPKRSKVRTPYPCGERWSKHSCSWQWKGISQKVVYVQNVSRVVLCFSPNSFLRVCACVRVMHASLFDVVTLVCRVALCANRCFFACGYARYGCKHG